MPGQTYRISESEGKLQKAADVLFLDRDCGSAVIFMANLSSNSQRERGLALSAKLHEMLVNIRLY